MRSVRPHLSYACHSLITGHRLTNVVRKSDTTDMTRLRAHADKTTWVVVLCVDVKTRGMDLQSANCKTPVQCPVGVSLAAHEFDAGVFPFRFL